MKKTIQVNLSGQVFTLDEDAYDRLSAYLNQISRLYDRSAGKEEILQDIEVRIAELFIEKLGELRQVVSLRDVESVIEIMGRPEQFEGDFDGDTEASGSSTYEENEYRARRLFRDPDDQVIGGVCSGIGYYFGIDPLWVRIAFVLALVVFGTGVLFYIILLIIVPEAKTASEKLHMRGEPVNIGSIGKSIEEELNAFGERISNSGGAFGRSSGKKLARGIDRTFYFIAELLRKLFNVIGKFLGALFVILGTFTVIALLAALFNVADVIHFGADRWSASMDIYEWGEIVFDSSEWLIASVAGLFLLVGIPFIALAYSGLTLLFPGNRIPYLGTALFGLWFLGLVLTIFSGFSILKSFSKEETVIERYALEELGIRQDTLIIRSGSDPFNISASRGYSANRDFMIKLSDDKVTRGNLEFTIMEMPSKRAVVEICKRSEGATFDQAQSKAEAINYSFENDSNTLIFNPFFTFPSRDLLRAQELTIHLSMTEGMVVFLDESSKRIIKDIPSVTNIYDPYMTGHYWKMEKEGLICLDCEEVEKSDTQNEGIKEVSIQVNID
jgi:phage shock protein PspC (stress-responsive transcriptional regulator)